MRGPRTIRLNGIRADFIPIYGDGRDLCAIERAISGRHLQGEGVDIFAVDFDARRIGDARVYAGARPMLIHAIDANPKHFVVTKGPSRETNFVRRWIAAPGDDRVDAAIDFGLGARFVTVGCVRPDDVRELEAFFFQSLGHDVGGLLLFIDFAAVSHGWTVEQVDGPIGAIIPMPECSLVIGRFDAFVLKNLQEIRRLGKSRSWRGGGPAISVMRGEMPRG